MIDQAVLEAFNASTWYARCAIGRSLEWTNDIQQGLNRSRALDLFKDALDDCQENALDRLSTGGE